MKNMLNTYFHGFFFSFFYFGFNPEPPEMRIR